MNHSLNHITRSLTLGAVLLSLSHFAFAANTIKAEVNGMVCAFCAKGIEKKLKSLPETQSTFVDLSQRVVVLELKDGQNVSDAAFSQVIQDAGYSVAKIEHTDKTAAAIKQELATQGAKK